MILCRIHLTQTYYEHISFPFVAFQPAISEKIKREKPSVDDYEHVREEVLALVQYSYTEKKAILIGLMKKIVPIFPLSSTQ